MRGRYLVLGGDESYTTWYENVVRCLDEYTMTRCMMCRYGADDGNCADYTEQIRWANKRVGLEATLAVEGAEWCACSSAKTITAVSQ